MPPKSKPIENPDDLFEVFAPSVIPVPLGTGTSVIIGEFVAVTQGPKNEYGIPLVVEFSAIAGESIDSNGELWPLVPGEHYSLWLLHSTLRDSFIEARPPVGEKFAVKHFGRKLKKGADEDLDSSYYQHIAAVFPDREKVDKTISWDDAAK